jgi:hypothetical protein
MDAHSLGEAGPSNATICVVPQEVKLAQAPAAVTSGRISWRMSSPANAVTPVAVATVPDALAVVLVVTVPITGGLVA